MKLTTIIILAACLHTSANGIAQQTVTFSGREVSLENVFTAIKKQTNYRFFFNTDMLQRATKISIEVKNASIDQVMNLVLKDQPLTFAIKGRTIFIMKKPEEEKKTSQNVDMTGDPVTVSGKVTDDQGQPLVGANVKVKGSNTGVTTDNQGRFTLTNVDPNATLEISFVGHETQLLSVKGKTLFTVALGQKISTLDETIVIAYGTTSRRFTTGNVATVKSIDIEKQPVQNPLLALQGRIPGLFITQETGVPGGAVTVRVQGRNSIVSRNSPLYVVDGVPFFSQLPVMGNDVVLGNSPDGLGASPLSFINPSDIESIDVLKDADATAIYGSRAANGAILITTKKGKVGKTKSTFNVQHGFGKVTRLNEMLDRRQYLDMRYEAIRNDGIDLNKILRTNARYYDLKVWDTTRYTDWQKLLIGGTSNYTNVSVGISGGTESVQFLIGSTYNKSTTVFPGGFSDQRLSTHFNIKSTSANKKFHLEFTGNYMYDDNRLPSTDMTSSANTLEPVAPNVYKDDGTLNWAPDSLGSSTWDNPFVSIVYRNFYAKTNNLISNLGLNYELIDGLFLKASIGYNSLQVNNFSGTPLMSIMPERRVNSVSSATYGNSTNNTWIVEPQILYNRTLGRAKLEGIIGSTIQQSKSTGRVLNGQNYPNDEVLQDFKAALTLQAGPSTVSQYKYNALFGNVNFKWDEKYIINMVARRDGSSRFGINNRFQTFGSIGAAWIFGSEKFIEKTFPFLSFGKIKGSYGTTGNDGIGDYSYLSLYSYLTSGIPYQNSASLNSGNLSNPYVQWEETRKFSLGIDLGFLNDRILINAAFAKNRSSNQLLEYNLPIITGRSSIIENFPATIQNINWEFSLNSTNIKTAAVKWTSAFNLTIPRNKVASFPGIENTTYASGSAGVIIGEPLGIVKRYLFNGVDPLTGNYLFINNNGDITASPTSADRISLKSNAPKFYGGLENIINIKNFEISFLFQFVKQEARNAFYSNGISAYGPGVFVSGYSNQPITVLDRWQKSGDEVTVAKFKSSLTANSVSLAYVQGSTAGFTDASFVRLKNINLLWSFPKQWLRKVNVDNARMYLQAQNLLTITNFAGQDPENIGSAVLPPLRLVTVGMFIGL
ncbi:SusC/RagA family TonB-linked outer membrane protein [Niastella caeni]|nr:SusC/RagA family TonB-linked outer membrane protein [Niastella caeni]